MSPPRAESAGAPAQDRRVDSPGPRADDVSWLVTTLHRAQQSGLDQCRVLLALGVPASRWNALIDAADSGSGVQSPG